VPDSSNDNVVDDADVDEMMADFIDHLENLPPACHAMLPGVGTLLPE
jgi:hypothetical protein